MAWVPTYYMYARSVVPIGTVTGSLGSFGSITAQLQGVFAWVCLAQNDGQLHGEWVECSSQGVPV